MTRPLKIGLLGTWHTHAEGLVRQIAAHPQEFQLLASWDSDPDRAAAAHARWRPLVGDYRLCTRAEDLLSEPLDAVCVEGRVYENVALARMALESGRPVYLEKPAGVDLAAHKALVAMARERKLHMQMAYLFRYMPAVRAMREAAKRGELGQLYMFRGRLPKDRSLYDTYVEELGRYPGGIFFEMAGHLIDLMVHLLGAPRRVRSLMCHHHSGPPPEFVDNGVAVFDCAGGLGIVEVPALETAPNSRRIELFGTAGARIIQHLGSGHITNTPYQRLESWQEGGQEWRTTDFPNEPLQISDLREFTAVIRGEKDPEFSLDHDLAVHDALLTACEMLDPGRH